MQGSQCILLCIHFGCTILEIRKTSTCGQKEFIKKNGKGIFHGSQHNLNVFSYNLSTTLGTITKENHSWHKACTFLLKRTLIISTQWNINVSCSGLQPFINIRWWTSWKFLSWVHINIQAHANLDEITCKKFLLHLETVLKVVHLCLNYIIATCDHEICVLVGTLYTMVVSIHAWRGVMLLI